MPPTCPPPSCPGKASEHAGWICLSEPLGRHSLPLPQIPSSVVETPSPLLWGLKEPGAPNFHLAQWSSRGVARSEQAEAGRRRGTLQIPWGRNSIPRERRIHSARDNGPSRGWRPGNGEERETPCGVGVWRRAGGSKKVRSHREGNGFLGSQHCVGLSGFGQR